MSLMNGSATRVALVGIAWPCFLTGGVWLALKVGFEVYGLGGQWEIEAGRKGQAALAVAALLLGPPLLLASLWWDARV